MWEVAYLTECVAWHAADTDRLWTLVPPRLRLSRNMKPVVKLLVATIAIVLVPLGVYQCSQSGRLDGAAASAWACSRPLPSFRLLGLKFMQACGALCWEQWTTGPGSCAVAQQQLLL